MTTAERIFSIVCTSLYEKLPALALPLGRLNCRDAAVRPAGTDGAHACFAPGWLEQEFLARSDAPAQYTLHLLLHLMLGHVQKPPALDAARWDTACDLAVMMVRHALLPQEKEPDMLFSARCTLQARKAAQAQAIYALLEMEPDVLTDTQCRAAALDDHQLWGAAPLFARAAASADGGETGWQALGHLLPDPLPQKPTIGRGTGHAAFAVKPDARGSRQLTALLHELSELRENRHVSDDEFQYAWYLYGLEHYSNMPLLEPLEYSEERRLRELAIVLDTSASCSRSLCASFLGELAGLIARQALFFERFNLHIIECDCEVQADTRLTTLQELRDWLCTMTLHGGGGTDFRPAISYVDGLVSSGELAHLQGLLYFTDGYGVFPDLPPAYRVIFVMLQYRCDDIDLPPWAEHVILSAERPKGDEAWI